MSTRDRHNMLESRPSREPTTVKLEPSEELACEPWLERERAESGA
jgi:uracil-DNA glycosylase